MAGQFTVSDQGTSQYDIPIQVPPGRAGVEPVLSLHYSAGRSNGEAGIAWKLEGLSQITRCGETYALDGYSAPIQNSPQDHFCIDGKRLEVVHGSYGSDGALYRTLIDTFSKIVSHQDSSSEGTQLDIWPVVARAGRAFQGPDYFDVMTKDGRKLTYGNTRDSVVLNRNGGRELWLLNRVEDRSGNSMTIHYENLRAEVSAEAAKRVPNYVRPKAIFYTGHGSSEGSREVRFDYENRFDGQINYAQGGAPMLLTHRLSQVTTFVKGDPIKNYRLSYKSQNLSQLTQVQECTQDTGTVCKPPTQFEYEEESGAFEQAASNLTLENAGQLDVNGDGLPDFLVTTVHVGDVPANPWLKGAAHRLGHSHRLRLVCLPDSDRRVGS